MHLFSFYRNKIYKRSWWLWQAIFIIISSSLSSEQQQKVYLKGKHNRNMALSKTQLCFSELRLLSSMTRSIIRQRTSGSALFSGAPFALINRQSRFDLIDKRQYSAETRPPRSSFTPPSLLTKDRIYMFGGLSELFILKNFCSGIVHYILNIRSIMLQLVGSLNHLYKIYSHLYKSVET